MASFLFTPMALTLGAADNNTTLGITLFRTTLVELTLTSSITLFGIAATGGNVDGTVMCFSIIAGTSFSLAIPAESVSATAVNRLVNGGAAAVALYGSVTLRYSGTLLRWVILAKS